MKEFNCDLHFHGPNSAGVSKNMLLPVIAEQAKLKGLDVCGTADITHKGWLEHVRENVAEEENGVFKAKDGEMFFIVQTEIQCNDKVHNLVFLPDLAEAENLREKLQDKGILDSWGCGRPRLRLSSEELAQKVEECNGIIGPAHAFTPYFSVYAHFDSMQGCYKSMSEKISVIELGLSADSNLADLIPDNHNYQFITCSDSHSPWPHRIGREFTRIKMNTPCFKELRKAFEQKTEKLVSLNTGLDPREGKYHSTACNSCYAKYSLKEAEKMAWSCPKCRGTIKRGVKDRVQMLAQETETKHPGFRPEYKHLLPLAEIIQETFGVKQVQSARVQSLWRDFVEFFGNEIAVLVDAEEEELQKVDKGVAESIVAFRKGWVHYVSGGGGNYGKPVICLSQQEFEEKAKELEEEESKGASQKTLGEF